MDLRAKRSTASQADSQPPPVAIKRRSIKSDTAIEGSDGAPRNPEAELILELGMRRANYVSTLVFQPNADNTAGCLMFPGKFRLLVKGEQWASWSQSPSKIPMYILEALFDPKHDQAAIPEMDLVAERVPQCGPREQDNIILEQISKKGAIFLQDKFCQSEIGNFCTAHQTKCNGNAFTLMGPEVPQTQYLTQIPPGMIQEQLYRPLRNTKSGSGFTPPIS